MRSLAPGQRPSRQRAAPPTRSLKQDVKPRSWLLAAIKPPVSRAFPWAAGCRPALANYFLLTPVPPALLIGGIITHFPSLKAAVGWVLAVGMGTGFLPGIACLSAAGGGFLVALGQTGTVLFTQPYHLPHRQHPRAPARSGSECCVLAGSWCFVSCRPLFEEGEEGLLLLYFMPVCGLRCNDGRGDSTE